MQGIISRYIEDKGYGFIYADNRMIFFHISDVLTTDIIPEEGFITKFKLANTYKGVKAVEIFIEPNQIIQLGERQINLSDITYLM